MPEAKVFTWEDEERMAIKERSVTQETTREKGRAYVIHSERRGRKKSKLDKYLSALESHIRDNPDIDYQTLITFIDSLLETSEQSDKALIRRYLIARTLSKPN